MMGEHEANIKVGLSMALTISIGVVWLTSMVEKNYIMIVIYALILAWQFHAQVEILLKTVNNNNNHVMVIEFDPTEFDEETINKIEAEIEHILDKYEE